MATEKSEERKNDKKLTNGKGTEKSGEFKRQGLEYGLAGHNLDFAQRAKGVGEGSRPSDTIRRLICVGPAVLKFIFL